jgi:hypothetical protein
MCRRGEVAWLVVLVVVASTLGVARASGGGAEKRVVQAAPASDGAELLTNTSIVEMTRAGLGAFIIVAKIRSTPNAFDLTVPALIALKQAGVADAVLEAMVGSEGQRRAIGVSPAAGADTPPTATVAKAAPQTPPKPEPEQPTTPGRIKEEASEDAVRSCRTLGAVSGSVRAEGFFSSVMGGLVPSKGREIARMEALKQAAALGATHVVWSQTGSSIMYEYVGKAFKCG